MGALKIRDNSGIEWRICPQYISAMANFCMVKAESAGEIVKESPARKVFFTVMGEIPCVVKIFYNPKLADRLRDLFFSSRVEQEWKYLNLLYHSLPVPEPIAIGKRGDICYLVERRIAGLHTLRDILLNPQTHLSFVEKRVLWRNVSWLIVQMHRAGIVHRDLHFGNIGFDADNHIYLLDLHDVMWVRNMNKRRRLGNLAMLGSSFTLCNTYTDYLCLFRNYYRLSTCLYTYPYPRCVKEAFQSLNNYQIHFWKSRIHRCLQINKYFGKISLPHGTGFYNCESTAAIEAFANLKQTIDQGTVLKSSRSTSVLKTKYGILKEFHRKKWRRMLFDCFRDSKAKHAWIFGNHCCIRSIPTARPIGFLERRRGCFLVANYILTQEISGQTMGKYLNMFETRAQGNSFCRKKSLLQRLGRNIRIMHSRGLYHRDLKFNNIMVDQEQNLYFIDMEGLHSPYFLTQKRRSKDLRRLVQSLKTLPNMTRTDLLRLLCSYLPFSKQSEQRWWIKKLGI